MSETPKNQEQEPTNEPLYCINGDTARLEVIKLSDHGDTVRIRGKETEWIELNHLLPEEYRFEFTSGGSKGTHCDTENRIVKLSDKDLGRTEWPGLLIILHEIGHAVRAQKSPDETRRLIELNLKGAEHNTDTPKLFKEFHKLRSDTERDAWAFAIKSFRTLTDSLGIDKEEINLSTSTVKNLARMSLLSYKKAADFFSSGLPELEKDEIKKELSKLYTSRPKPEDSFSLEDLIRFFGQKK